MTPDKTPTPEEIHALAMESGLGWAVSLGGMDQFLRKYTDSVLAKWGSPVVAGEPVKPDFYTACGRHEGGLVPLPAYSHATEQGVMNLVLEAARREGYKGAAAERLLELGWVIRPVYLTPQPTQAQAGAPGDDGFNPTPGAIYQSHGHGTVTFKTMDFERGEPIYHFDTARGERHMKRERMLRDIQRPVKAQAGAVKHGD